MSSNAELNKHISQDRWPEFFEMLSSGNQGRHVSLEVVDQELGDLELIDNASLKAIVYDPANKGNDLVIETGHDEVAYAHTINSPTEVWTKQDENGVVEAISITDAAENQTILTLN
jgi:Family of unknown function (DUF5335)